MERSLRVKKAQIEMIRTRGYGIPPEEEAIMNMTTDQFKQYLANLQSGLKTSFTLSLLTKEYYRQSGTGPDKILVYYAGKGENGKQVQAETIKVFVNRVRTEQFQQSILIVDAALSSGTGGASSALENLGRHDLQIFHVSEFYNPIKHIDVPQHILLTEQQKIDKMAELRVNSNKMPLIRRDDPIVKYYGWPVDGMIKIIRKDYGAGQMATESINYRIIKDLQ